MKRILLALALIVSSVPAYAQQWDQVNGSMQVKSGPSAPLVIIDQTAASQKILSLRANGTEKCYINTAGDFSCSGGTYTFGPLTISSTAVTSTVPVIGPAGTNTAPSFATGDANLGIFKAGTNQLGIAVANDTRYVFQATTMGVISDIGAYTLGVASDAILTRDAAAAFQLGLNAAGVTNQMLKGPDRITSDGVGGNLTIAGGRNRGASAGGSVIIQTAPAAGAGNPGVLATALTIDSTKLATFAGGIVTVAGGLTTTPLSITNGTNLTTATANAVENDGVARYFTHDTTNGRKVDDEWNFFELTGDGTGISTIADFFGATGSGIPLVANGRYEIEWHCVFTQATAGTATWTIVTATTALAILDAGYIGTNIAGGGAVGAPQTAWVNTTSSSSTALPVTGTEATGVTHQFDLHAIVTAGNGASNTRLRLTMGAGTATPKAGSYIKVRRLPAGNTGTFVS
jgi:hypothetical protein